MRILLEYAPDDFDVAKLRTELSQIGNVVDLHVWSLSEAKVCLTVHLIIE